MPNRYDDTADDTCTVEAGVAADLVALRGSYCRGLICHAAGTLVYTTIAGDERTETVTEGWQPIKAKAIGTGTTMRVNCYFNTQTALR